MNKLFTKIASLSIGLALAIGVGVAVGGNEAKVASAEDQTVSWTATASSDLGSKISSVNGTDTGTISTGSFTWNYTRTLKSLKSGKSDYIAYVGPTDNKYIQMGSGSSGEQLTLETTAFVGKIIKSMTVICLKGSSGPHSLSITIGGNAYSTATSATIPTATNNQSGNLISTHADGTLTYTSTVNHNSGKIIIDFGTVSSNKALYLAGISITYETPSTKTLSSIALSGTYSTSFTVDDAFNHTGMVVTANYSDSTSANVTSSASWSSPDMSSAGQKTVTVSYTEGGTTKTADYIITVSAPSTPYITPAKASTSGYEGQNESLSFTYGNLTSSLSVSSSNTSYVTVETPSYDAGSGTVQINFVKAGSTTVKFYDGASEKASVSVTVNEPTVTITGMPSTRSVSAGSTLDLGALITVTPTGSLSSDVTWSTSNSSIASVTQAGIVTCSASGSATITVTPDDYHAGAVSCTVTVSSVFSAVFGTTGSNSSTEVTDADKYKTDYSYTIDSNITLSDISKVYPQTSNALKFGSSSAVGSMTFSIPSTINSKPVYITNVTVRAVRYSETKGTTLLIGGVEKALTYSADDYTADLSSGEVTSFVLTVDSSSGDKRMYIQSISIEYAFNKTLSSIALSGTYQTTFTKDGTFNHDGLVVTATYSDSSNADVSNSSTFSGYNLSNVGNQTVTVSYTEKGTTKTATYSITVNYASVSSVSITTHAAEIGLGEDYSISGITPTVLPANADKTTEWIVSANTVSDDYTWNETKLTAGATEGTVTLRCRSTADNSKYDELVISISGDPIAAFAKNSTSGFAGKSETVSFTYNNFDAEDIAIESGNASYVTIGTISASEGSGTVIINFVGAGSTFVTIGDGSSTLDTLTVTVSADSVKAVTWSATNIDVFSGATLSTTGWNVQYEMDSGDHGSAATYTIKLGSEIVTAGYVFKAADSGKTMHVEYGGVSSSSITVTVTQTINNVNAEDLTNETGTWTAASTDEIRNNTTGSLSTNRDGWNWSFERTDAYTGWVGGSSNYYQVGKNGEVADLTLSGTFTGTITEIDIECYSYNGAHDLTITVGGKSFYSSTTTPTSLNTVQATGNGTGEVVITFNNGERAMYIKSVSVSAVVPSGTTTQIANDASHKAAQRVAVAFATAFNAAMDETENCTTGLDAAWSTCSSAYTTFCTAAAALGTTEEAWAKKLIKYATVQYSNDSGEACIERMMKTYEICVKVHGKNPFMSELKPLGANVSNTIMLATKNTSAVIIIVVISAISAAAVGGYFLFRKKKED